MELHHLAALTQAHNMKHLFRCVALLYGFTMDDPATRTKPYSIEFVMWRLTDQEQLVEYACHEGNVNLEFTLSGARAKEREEAEQQEK